MSRLYQQKNLISSVALTAKNTDPNNAVPIGILINNCTIWVTQNSTSTASQYELDGSLLATVATPALPTGLVFNPLSLNGQSSGFLVSNGTLTGSANLILVTQNGVIAGFNPTVDPLNFITTFTGAGKVFKGVALATQDGCNSMAPAVQQLYVTNFASGFIEIYSSTWTFVSQFTDTNLTSIGYAPFGIAVRPCDNIIFVSFAQQNEAKTQAVPGVSLGYVDVFSVTGVLLSRFASGGPLNAPYGIVPCSDFVLIGNNGDGRILRYEFVKCDNKGNFEGPLMTCEGGVIENGGLWGLAMNPTTGSDVFFNALTLTGVLRRKKHRSRRMKPFDPLVTDVARSGDVKVDVGEPKEIPKRRLRFAPDSMVPIRAMRVKSVKPGETVQTVTHTGDQQDPDLLSECVGICFVEILSKYKSQSKVTICEY
jgi:uncharacterized protein (TIGR03118 family)